MNKFIDHLHSLNVHSVYFCSGARNHSLKNVFAGFKMNFHFDERVSAFMALGEAKASGRPVVVCTTSGTAVAECLPAVIEAYYSNVKLIIVSADRPERLRGTHAPQAINQLNIFSDFVRSKYNGKITDYAGDSISFPFHVNFEIDDQNCELLQGEVKVISKDQFKHDIDLLTNPLVVFTEDDEDNTEYFNYFGALGFMLYKECTSNIKSTHENCIQYDHTIVSMLEDGRVDGVIKFGRTPISKSWRLLDNTYSKVPVFSIQIDKTGLSRGYILENKSDVLSSQINHKLSDPVKENDILHFIKKYTDSEFAVFNNILNKIEAGSIVFLGNSMAVRYGQLLYRNTLDYMAMRGANGIDGQISCAIGVAKMNTQNIHLIIGDLTFMYDLNSLLIDWPKNLFVHVLNNKGGRIFERIQLSKEVINEHDIDLKKICQGFGTKSISIYDINNEQTRNYWEDIK